MHFENVYDQFEYVTVVNGLPTTGSFLLSEVSGWVRDRLWVNVMMKQSNCGHTLDLADFDRFVLAYNAYQESHHSRVDAIDSRDLVKLIQEELQRGSPLAATINQSVFGEKI